MSATATSVGRRFAAILGTLGALLAVSVSAASPATSGYPLNAEYVALGGSVAAGSLPQDCTIPTRVC